MKVRILAVNEWVDMRTSGGRFTLLDSFHASVSIDGEERLFVVPAGFDTDLASVPRPLWFWAPRHGKYSLAAVLHDYLYRMAPVSRREADAIFYALMRDLGVRRTQAWVMWAAVRLGAWAAWGG